MRWIYHNYIHLNSKMLAGDQQQPPSIVADSLLSFISNRSILINTAWCSNGFLETEVISWSAIADAQYQVSSEMACARARSWMNSLPKEIISCYEFISLERKEYIEPGAQDWFTRPCVSVNNDQINDLLPHSTAVRGRKVFSRAWMIRAK